jgi:sugar O-acyltransferase (sialic acid O-acetyltransferase NeuD family)
MTEENPSREKIIVFGAGGHAKSVIDLILAQDKYELVGLVDDTLSTREYVMGFPVLGSRTCLPELIRSGIHLAVNSVGGIGNPSIRIAIFELLEKSGFDFPPVIHPRACVEPSAHLADGVQVLAMAYIGSEAQVGFGTIVNYGAILSHEVILGKYVNISPGAILAGRVHVADASQVGMGVTINLDIMVGREARIGNSAVIKKNVPNNAVIRAGAVWPPLPDRP